VSLAEKYPERSAKLKMLLFKPFRHIEDLRESGQTWVEAWNAYAEIAPPRILRWVQNLTAITAQEQAGIEVRKQRLEDLKMQGYISAGSGHDAFDALGMLRGDEEDAAADISEIDAPLYTNDEEESKYRQSFFNELKLNNSSFPVSDPGQHMYQCLQTIGKLGLFDGLKYPKRCSQSSNDNNDSKTPFVIPCVANMQGLRRILAKAVTTLTPTIQLSENKQRTNDLRSRLPDHMWNKLPEAWKIQLPQAPTPDEIAEAFQLNVKQQHAFFIVAKYFAMMLRRHGLELCNKENLCRGLDPEFSLEPLTNDNTLRMYMGGAGGTGKSHVIAAIN
jgi:hypothetical protein